MSSIVVAWTRHGTSSNRILNREQGPIYGFGNPRRFFWSDNCISLGGTISGFLPEDKYDRQPLWAADGSCCLVADVRLDNRAELGKLLELTQPEQLADSTILLHAWLRWGAACLDYVLGGFAFAVWTPERQELFAARDHTGERPLHYSDWANVFALASLPQTLLTPESAGFDTERVGSWFSCVPCHSVDRTFFASVRRVPAGHVILATPRQVTLRRYWHPSAVKPTSFRRDSEYAEALVDVLDRATDARLRSTAPFGLFLSAGLDSTSVAASAASLLARCGQRLTAFTAVPRPEFHGGRERWHIPSEAEGAAELVRMYPNIDHVLIDSAGRDLVRELKRWNDAAGEPALGPMNVLWGGAIFDEARSRGIQVMLEGTLGNGTISWGTNAVLGYMLRQGHWAKLLRTAVRLRRNGGISARAAVRYSFAGLLPKWCDQALFPPGATTSLYQPLMRNDHPCWKQMQQRIFDHALRPTADPVQEQTVVFEWFDFGVRREVVQTEYGIDLRDPTADKRVYEFCFSIPPEQYMSEGHSRSLVRRAMKGRIPESTRLGYKRGLQGADWYITFAEALPAIRAEVAEIGRSPAAREWIDMERLHRLLDTWPVSGYETVAVASQWHYALSRAVSLGNFLRTHDPAVERPAAEPAVHCVR